MRKLTERPRVWRTFLVLVFLVPILLVLPHARSLVVRNAVVTAYLSDINSPISGEVTAINIKPGTAATAGETVLVIENNRVDRSQLDKLDVLRRGAEQELAKLRINVEKLRALTQERRDQTDNFAQAVGRDEETRLGQLQERGAALESSHSAVQEELRRARSLHESGLLSTAELEATEARFEAVKAELASNRQEQVRAREQIEEVEMGVFQVDVPDGALLSRQMSQQLDLELLTAERQLIRSEAAWKAAEAEYQAMSRAVDHLSRQEQVLRPGKSVFDIYTSVGGWVMEGSRLMSVIDCSNLMVDIAMDDAILELIEPGQSVRVRMFGTLSYKSATVILVRGSAALDDMPVLAAAVQDRGLRKGRVLAKLDASGIESEPGQTCGVGRSAYAEFEDISMFKLLVYPLFR